MPELPEVYTMSKDLKKLVGRKIIGIWADKPGILDIVKKTEGRKILSVARKGKNIVFNLDQNLSLLIHPKMTGRFLLNQRDKYERIIFQLSRGSFLIFSDKRRFAKIAVFSKKEIVDELSGVGADTLGISFQNFKNLIHSKPLKIKQVLMDQSTISGIGNIYADEILWKSKIHPTRITNLLSEKELKTIFVSIKSILQKSIKLRGVSIQDYRDVFGRKGEYQNHLLVYGRAGEKCKRCSGKIERIKISQRSAHFCPKCQI